jgi:hypothetical protein
MLKGKDDMSEKLMTRNPFRGSFASLATPSLPHGETDQSKLRYQITIALPKADPFWKEVGAEIKAVATEKWGKIPATLKRPVKDGDAIVDDDGELKYPEFEGCYTLQVSSKRKPDVADAQLNPVIEADALYSGAWYRVTCRAYAWSHPTGGKGVSFALETVQKVKDDEPLGGSGGKAEDDFADFAEKPAAGGGEEAGAEDLLG